MTYTYYGPDQGDEVRGVGRDVATRAWISGAAPSSSFDGMLLGSVAIQNASPAGTPTRMIQIGELYQSWGFDNFFGGGLDGGECSGTGTQVFVETLDGNADNPANYTCHPIQGITPFGSGGQFAIVHISGGWEAQWNGQSVYKWVTPAAADMTSGDSVARAETYWEEPDQGFPGSGFYVKFGDNDWAQTGDAGGHWIWEFKTNSNGCCTSWTPVVSTNPNSQINPTGDWTFGSPDGTGLPNGVDPFSIRGK